MERDFQSFLTALYGSRIDERQRGRKIPRFQSPKLGNCDFATSVKRYRVFPSAAQVRSFFLRFFARSRVSGVFGSLISLSVSKFESTVSSGTTTYTHAHTRKRTVGYTADYINKTGPRCKPGFIFSSARNSVKNRIRFYGSKRAVVNYREETRFRARKK